MNIELKYITDNEDGSANCLVEMDAAAVQAMLRVGLITALYDALDKSKQYEVKEEDK